jgi:membrane associated rhomboid family serine protease
MIPLKDDIPSYRFPVITIALIVINVLVFVYELLLGPRLDNFMLYYGFIPARFVWQQSLDFYDFSRFIPVFTSMFLHAGPMHLIGNMWMLWIFGDNVEDCMGRGRFVMFYLMCGVTSVLVQTFSAPQSQMPLVGASGAISGVLGAYFLTYPKARVLTLVPVFIIFYLVDIPAFFFLGFWFLLQFIQGYSYSITADGSMAGQVAWWAHVGGFLAGVFLVHFFRRKDWRRTAGRTRVKMQRYGKYRR